MKPVRTLTFAACLVVVGACSDQTAPDTHPTAPVNDLLVQPGEEQSAAIELQTRSAAGSTTNLLEGQYWYRCNTSPWQTRPHSNNFEVTTGDCWYMGAYLEPGRNFRFSCEIESEGRGQIDITYYDENWRWLSWTPVTGIQGDHPVVVSQSPVGTTAGSVTVYNPGSFEFIKPGEEYPSYSVNFRNCALYEVPAEP